VRHGACDFDFDRLQSGPFEGPATGKASGSAGGLLLRKEHIFFFFNLDDFRQAGAVTQTTATIPSLLERRGNFSDWVDSNGNLIPVYDRATTQSNPNEDCKAQIDQIERS
jgi:hypothetical protein